MAAAILTASVVHDVRNRRELAAELGDWEEVECGGDRECQAALCPGGMVYREEEGHCTVLPGNDISCSHVILSSSLSDHQCCTLWTHEYLCFPSSLSHTMRCLLGEGIVPSAYKQTCHQGFLWVQWKRKCVRKN